MSTKSKWLTWKPEGQILAKTPGYELTKPTEPGFVSFGASPLTISPKIGAGPARLDDEDRETPWAEWKAATLNRLFLEQGVLGQPGKITAATVRHGERRRI